MSCPIEDIREYDIQRLLDYVNTNSASYYEWANRYLTSTSATSAAIINAAIGSATNFAQISGNTLQVNGNIQTSGNLQTTYVLSSSISYNVANQNQPYLIAGTPSYTGATTNWGTYGMQHRFKTNNSATPRITIDSSTAELFTVQNNGNVGINTNSPQTKLHVAGDVQTDGNLKIINTTTPLTFVTSATSDLGNGGSASPLPANPIGYLKFNINGTDGYIPFY
jgi:hypothetical protein